MTKKYNSPMLQVVSITNNVIATSGEPYNKYDNFIPDRPSFAPSRFDDYYEGY